jgi:hypothetical protein
MAISAYPANTKSSIFPTLADAIAKATVTSTTGSPSIDTTTRPGKTIYRFTGTGSITIGTAWTCEVLLVGGGGSGGYSLVVRDTTGIVG